jgi:phosphoserine/homoserine phosphotransferase
MKILCTDLEGTLAPEIWQEIGRHYNIPELNATTREIPEFEDLMNMRMEALKHNTIKYSELKEFLKTIEPYEGAKEFLSSLTDKYQVVIVSDTFYELALPVIKKLGDFQFFVITFILKMTTSSHTARDKMNLKEMLLKVSGQ